MWGELVTVVNRTTKPLEFMWDGRAYVLKPGENPGIYESLAGHAKSKFPVMGTESWEDPVSFVCLIGVKEWNDPITPLEQSDAIERFDPESLPNKNTRKGEPGRRVAGPQRSWRPMANAVPQNEVSFTK